MADQLAKSAAAREFPEPSSFRTSLSKVKLNTKERSGNEEQDYWRGLKDKLVSTNHLIGHVIPLITTKQPVTSTKVVNFLSNRGTLGVFLFKRGLIQSELCRWCTMEKEDNSHILCFCQALSPQRGRHFHSLTLHPQSVATINLKCLESYLDDIGVMDNHPGLPTNEE